MRVRVRVRVGERESEKIVERRKNFRDGWLARKTRKRERDKRRQKRKSRGGNVPTGEDLFRS